MRWFWIDRFTEFESGRRATAIKNISLAEEHLHDHFPGSPLMPNSLVVEGLAQTGGLLVSEHGGFAERVVLAKISKAKFHCHGAPGDTLTYRTTIDDISKQGAMITATSHIGDRLQAEAEIFFAHLDSAVDDRQLFDPATFRTMLTVLGIFTVGRDAQGNPLRMPAHLQV